jgi:putative Mn2+ efflux pump MntP
MPIDFSFFLSNILLGVGLSMDAFSISLANGLNEPDMRRRRLFLISGVFAVFQAVMPLLGWVCVHTVLEYFKFFEKLIPWIAFAVLGFIGGKMIAEGIKGGEEQAQTSGAMKLGALLIQGVATSIDALSAGFSLAEMDFGAALLSVVIIAAVTFIICTAGVLIGKTAGTKLADKAGILGGAILIVIGAKILIDSFL